MSVGLASRYRGSLVGCAVGDALGTTLEFLTGPFEKVHKDMTGGGRYSLLPGQWTDDTSMMLCLTMSLIEKKEFDPINQLQRYLKWYEEGHMSSNGVCFDIGIATRMAVLRFAKEPTNPYPGVNDNVEESQKRAGNGSLMRLTPVPLFYRTTPALAIENSANSSKTTHGSQLAVDSCRYFAALLIGALEGKSKEELLSDHFVPNGLSADYWIQNPLVPEVDEIASGSYKKKGKESVGSTGYVITSLEAVLWTLHHTNSFDDGLVTIVNFGGDADTLGAIYGQIAGAFYGVEAIQSKWRETLTFREAFYAFADELLSLSEWQSSKPDNYNHTESYNNAIKYLTTLEEGYKPILRKLQPGIHAYKDIQSFTKDVENFTSTYNQLPGENQLKSSLLKDYATRLCSEESKLKTKLQRPTNPFMLGALKKK